MYLVTYRISTLVTRFVKSYYIRKGQVETMKLPPFTLHLSWKQANWKHYWTFEGTKYIGAIIKTLRDKEVFLTCFYMICLIVQWKIQVSLIEWLRIIKNIIVWWYHFQLWLQLCYPYWIKKEQSLASGMWLLA